MAADASGDADGLKAAQIRLKDKEAKLKAFVGDTGRYQRTNRQQVYGFDRSQASRAVWAKKNLDFIKNDVKIKSESHLLPQLDLPDERLKHTVDVSISKGKGKLKDGLNGVVPKGVNLTDVYVLAGNGTSTPIRDLARLHGTYKRSPKGWQKKSGTAYAENFKYVVHWYEHNGMVPIDEIKLKGVGVAK